ncbi:hypothetical protein FQ775_12015 [Nitratireductor mangrovi]|uniref:Uncharacterized protein n=1 Tax=Nitratireductor mangrovi TaxID=2599600 RepID=A0A5B8L0F2_9HYPH|nr:hypothetical protein [Nitratireductor mangrovi]QDZ01048.1 hypothetical protein FQ775_12015 [Nitratireductor mangrovi]
MDAQQIIAPEADRTPLEAVEFELALNSQNIFESGFETAVHRAAEKADAAVLFHMPAPDLPDCQRIAAVSLGDGADAHTLLVLLQADGGSFRIESAAASDNPFAGIALSYRGLLDVFEPWQASFAEN